MKKCGKNCTACPYIREVKSLRINQSEWKINQSLNCEISNNVYLIECKKTNCTMEYVGETKRILKLFLAEHRGYVNNHDYTTATEEHFNSPGHSLSDQTITYLERVKSSDDLYRKEREIYFIRKFNTFYRGRMEPTTSNQQHTSNLVLVPVPVQPLNFPDCYRFRLKNAEMLLVLPTSCW